MKRFRVLLSGPCLAILIVGVLTLLAHALPLVEAPSRLKPEIDFGSEPRETIARRAFFGYCHTCHQSGRSGVDLALNIDEMRRERALWEDVVRRLRTHEMPPRKFPQPLKAQREAMIQWIEEDVLKFPPPAAPRYLVRRLQRVEYVNSIRDLLGVRYQPPVDFPADEMAFREGDEASELPSELAAKYRLAAQTIIEQALAGNEGELTAISHLGCDVGRAREVLADFACRAYRRPIAVDELDCLMSMFEQGECDGKNVQEAIRNVLTEVLTSRHFLNRAMPANDGVEEHTQFDLAARLSFFLWRSTPDRELLALAEQGTLEHDLENQVKRMLRDARSQAFAHHFAASWLSLNTLERAYNLDGAMRQAMRQETELFIGAIVKEDRSVMDILDADFTFLNEPLAKHYDIADVSGTQMRRVALQTSQRGGLLTHGSILNLTSLDMQTSPVTRGKWVLETILGAGPIRPPAGILLALENTSNNFGTGSIPKLLEVHRANPSCAQCHGKLDAIGVSLENFDARGAWRTTYLIGPVEPVGVLPNGEKLHGLPDLKRYLRSHQVQFIAALSEAMLRDALCRKLTNAEREALKGIPQRVAGHDNRFSRVIAEVVQSEPFRGATR